MPGEVINKDDIIVLKVWNEDNRNEYSVVEIYKFGAHVSCWRENDNNFLFLSELAVKDGSKPIRGGIPLIFPQFGGRGPMKSHGFARICKWNVADSNVSNDVVSVTLSLETNKISLEHWPYQFYSEYKITLSNYKNSSLKCQWMVENKSEDTMNFHTALHTYFNIDNINNTLIEGDVSGCKYIDQLQDGKECVEEGKAIDFKGEVDRIYQNISNNLVVNDQKRKIYILKTNFPDAVIWNPHIAKSKRMSDFGDNEYKNMCCVEAASILPSGIVLKTKEKWIGELLLKSQL